MIAVRLKSLARLPTVGVWQYELVSGNDVRVSVTGAASNNITWHGLLEVSQVST